MTDEATRTDMLQLMKKVDQYHFFVEQEAAREVKGLDAVHALGSGATFARPGTAQQNTTGSAFKSLLVDSSGMMSLTALAAAGREKSGESIEEDARLEQFSEIEASPIETGK